MTDKDIKTIAADLDSLHMKILNHKFAEVVSENEILSLVSAVKIISQQKVEIERLQSMNQAKIDTIHDLQVKIEQLDEDRNTYQNLYCMMVKDLETAKSEAVKEFSKSLIDKTHGGKISSTDILDFVVDYLGGLKQWLN